MSDPDCYAWRTQNEVLAEAIKAEFKRQIQWHKANARTRKWYEGPPDLPVADFGAIADVAITEIAKWPTRAQIVDGGEP